MSSNEIINVVIYEKQCLKCGVTEVQILRENMKTIPYSEEENEEKMSMSSMKMTNV
jgi:hypothetical protein